MLLYGAVVENYSRLENLRRKPKGSKKLENQSPVY